MLKFNSPPVYSSRSKRVTQQEIARIAGVSHVTVSYALHRKRETRVSQEKQEEIRQIAQSLGYQPRAMTTYNIGLCLPVQSLHLEVTSSLIVFADEILKKRGYRLSLATFDENQSLKQGFLLDQKNSDGVLLTDPRFDANRVIAPGLPRVLMADADEHHLTETMDHVSMDTRETMKRVVAYAMQQGHTKIGLVASSQRSVSVYDKHLRDSFYAAFNEFRLSPQDAAMIEIGMNDDTAGPLLKSLVGPNAPTLIIAGSSGRALYVLNTLQWAGYRVPEDVSLVSLTDSDRLAHLHPAVTTTTALNHEFVELAVDRLLSRIEDPHVPSQRVLVPGEMIERESVKSV